ncbi:COMM domain-containing protein 5-like [Amphiura filiformis]|uniref:COMM domain-containing protein 5-like n=1 Tax=Amphiura filiformis TaxID=82378 RepID=UPI003B21863E
MSMQQVIPSSKPGIAADRTLFVGTKVPTEVKLTAKLLRNVDKDTFRKFLKVAVSGIEGEDITEEIFSKLASSSSLSSEAAGTVYSGICTLLKCALRLSQNSLKPEIFKADLKDLKIPADFIPDLASAVFGSRRQIIEDAILDQGGRLPTLQRLKWRLDVAISTSALNRVLEPTILMETTLSDGAVHNFEVPISKFHELRYNVAYVLKEMEDLEKRSILKIQD